MKKITLSITAILAGVCMAGAQGTIKFFNITTAYLVNTNGTGSLPGQNGTTTGKTSTTANSFYYALLVSSTQPSSSSPTTGGWTVATSGGSTIVGNNYTSFAGGITGTGGTAGVAVDNWTPGTSMYVELVGWSASLGTTWSAVAAELQSGNWNAAGYFGISNIGQIVSGGAGTPATSPTVLFSGTGINSLVLNGVSPAPTPEPGTIALAGLGVAGLLALRRKK